MTGGKKPTLPRAGPYLVGRAEECDIRIDVSDKTVSRKHARIEASGKQVAVENLSATNPVMVNGKPVNKINLKDKGQFRIGETLFAVKKTGGGPVGSKALSPVRMVLIAVLVIICTSVLMLMVRGGNVPDKNGSSAKESASSDITTTDMTKPFKESPAGGLQNLGLVVSAEDMKKADQHFRQGMFFL